MRHKLARVGECHVAAGRGLNRSVNPAAGSSAICSLSDSPCLEGATTIAPINVASAADDEAGRGAIFKAPTGSVSCDRAQRRRRYGTGREPHDGLQRRRSAVRGALVQSAVKAWRLRASRQITGRVPIF
jgi:hypothetical protein